MGAEHSQESDQGGGFAAMCCRNSTRERRTVYDDWKSRRGPHDDEIRSIEGLSRRRAQENWGCVDGQSTTTADNCEWGCAEGDTASRAEERGGQNLGLEDTHFIEPQKEEQKTMAPMPLAHRSAGAKRGMSRPPQTAQKEFAKAERIYQQQHADLKSAWSVHNQKAKFYQLVNQVSEEDRQIVRAMTLQRSNKHYLMEGKVIKETMKQPYAWSEQIYNSWAPAKETSMNVGTVRNIGSSAKKVRLAQAAGEGRAGTRGGYPYVRHVGSGAGEQGEDDNNARKSCEKGTRSIREGISRALQPRKGGA